MPAPDHSKMVMSAAAVMISGIIILFAILAGDSAEKARPAIGALIIIGAGYLGIRYGLKSGRQNARREKKYQQRLIDGDVRRRVEEEQRQAKAKEKREAEAERKRLREQALDELVEHGVPKVEPRPPVPAAFKCEGCGAVNRTAEDGTMVCAYCGNPGG